MARARRPGLSGHGPGTEARAYQLSIMFPPMPLASIPIANRRIRFALVGCGRIAGKHFEAFEQHRDRAELVAVCDTDPEALKLAVARTQAPGFASLDLLLAQSNADVIVLATPSGLHSAQTIAGGGRRAATWSPRSRWPPAGRTASAMVDGLRPGRRAALRGQAEPPQRRPCSCSSGPSSSGDSAASTW